MGRDWPTSPLVGTAQATQMQARARIGGKEGAEEELREINTSDLVDARILTVLFVRIRGGMTAMDDSGW
ncbi:hypothetical protein BDV11DRAFT_184284 [Aspergillus similis]